MARILLVEDEPDLGLYEAHTLRSHGHVVVRCSGGPTLFSACPMLTTGSCALVDAVDLIVFSCRIFAPLWGRTYRGDHLLRAYREHPVYGRIPMLVVSLGAPRTLPGTGPIAFVVKFSAAEVVVAAAEALLSKAALDSELAHR